MPKLASRSRDKKVKAKAKVYPSQRDRPTMGIRLPKDLADWLRERSKESGMPIGNIVAQVLGRMKRRAARGVVGM